MTPELFWLSLTAVLAATLWLPFIVLSSLPENAGHQTFDRMAPVWQMSDVAQRAYRAHLNLLEQFLPFAVVVLVAHLAGVSNGATETAAVAYFWFRVAHYALYISNIPFTRTLSFTGAWLAMACILYQILTI